MFAGGAFVARSIAVMNAGCWENLKNTGKLKSDTGKPKKGKRLIGRLKIAVEKGFAKIWMMQLQQRYPCGVW